MPFTEPVKPNDTIDTVRKIARIAQMLLEMRTEYERRQNPTLLRQIQERAKELNDLALTLDKPAEDTPESQEK